MEYDYGQSPWWAVAIEAVFVLSPLWLILALLILGG